MKKLKNNEQEINYWESTADILVALLLLVILMVMALVMYLVKNQKNDFIDEEIGQYTSEFVDYTEEDSQHYDDDDDDITTTEHYVDHDDGGGGGGGGGAHEEHTGDYDRPGEGDLSKVAVHVSVIDGDTGNVIKTAGIPFELYQNDIARMTLSTFYPKKIEYTSFETTKEGTFYLPQKIDVGEYSLRNLKAPDGYDIAEKVIFSLDEDYDWPAPYEVVVTMYPQKNYIEISSKDREDGRALAGAVYNIIADGDIITQDGTVRFANGDVVDTITLDANGYGKSKEIFIGKYAIVMKSAPDFYAVSDTRTEVEVGKKNSSGTVSTQNILEDRTRVTINVCDALYIEKGIEGAVVSVDGVEYTTDADGKIKLDELSHNKTYHIKQISSADNFAVDANPYEFTVSADGLVENEPGKDIILKNRTIRIEIAVKDKVFQGQVSDINVSIVDMSGKLVKSFNSTGLEEVVEGIKPGNYKVVIRGNEAAAQEISIGDYTDIQKFTFKVWTTQGIGGLLGAAVVAIGILVGLVIGISRSAKRKKEK